MTLLRESYDAAWASGSTRASYDGWLENEVKRLRKELADVRQATVNEIAEGLTASAEGCQGDWAKHRRGAAGFVRRIRHV